MTILQQLQQELRQLRKEMKAQGIRRTSCFNGGLDAETYRANARVFALETAIQRRKDAAGKEQG